MSRRVLARSLLAVVVLLLPPESLPFFGNIKIGGLSLPCAVGCGGDRGILNFNFLGDAFHSFFTSSSIDSFDEKMKARGDAFLASAESKLNTVLDDKILKLNALIDSQRHEFFVELGNSADKVLYDFNEILARNVSDADLKLTEHSKSLGGMLYRSIDQLAHALLFVAAVGSILVFLILVAVGLRRKMAKKELYRRGALLAAVTASIIFIAWIASATFKYFLDRDQLNQYVEAFNSYEYSDAYLHAGILSFSNSKNKQYPIYMQKSAAFRDLMAAPTLIASTRLPEYVTSLRRASDAQFKLSGYRDPDIESLQALVEWRRTDSRLGEYYGAALAFNALRNQDKLNNGQKFKLEKLSEYYIAAYLQNPLSDHDLVSLELDRKQFAQDEEQSGNAFPSIEELRASLKNAGAGEKRLPLVYRELHLKTIPKYVRLVFLNSLASTSTSALLPTIRAEQASLAEEIIALWEEFAAFAHNQNASHRALSVYGLYAIYTRAKAYKRALPHIDHSFELSKISLGNLLDGDSNVVPKAIASPSDLAGQPCIGPPYHLGILKNIPPRSQSANGIYRQWTNDKDKSPMQRANALVAKAKLIEDEDRLFSFEYFFYLSNIPNGTKFVGCLDKGSAESLLPAILRLPPSPPKTPPPPSKENLPPYESIIFHREFSKTAPPPPFLPALFDLILVSDEADHARARAIVEATSLGLFVCSDKLEKFDSCKDVDTRITVSHLLLETYSRKPYLPIGINDYARASLLVRSLPTID